MSDGDDEPAFPGVYFDDGQKSYATGMTLRDYFAAAALTGLCASNLYDRAKGHQVPVVHLAAGIAYEYADAMLLARKT